MSEQLIDDFDSLNKTESTDRSVKIVVLLSTVFFLIISSLYSFQIHLLIGKYYDFRSKMIDSISTNSLINAVTISIIPFIAYRVWIKKTSFSRLRSYLVLLLFAIILFALFFVLGLELILQTALDYSNSNPLLPSYMLTPRFPYSFILVFVFSIGLTFLFLKLLFGKKSGKSTR